MKKFRSHLVLLVLTVVAACTPGSNKSQSTEIAQSDPNVLVGFTHGCGFNGPASERTIRIQQARPREMNQLESILRHTGLMMNFEVFGADIQNAIATIIDGRRIIVYDPILFNYADAQSGEYWTSMSILAHEIGHHLSGHTLSNSGSNLSDELVADRFSGFVLYKMGATLDQALQAIQLLGSDYKSTTHPARSDRVNAIADGWNEANNQRYSSALPPPPIDNAEDFYVYTKNMLIEREYLIADQESGGYWFEDVGYLYGIITEVEKDVSRFRVRIVRMDNDHQYFRDITGEDWTVSIDVTGFGGDNDMCRACGFNLGSLITPGRRLKFSMVESLPGMGSAMHGVWFLTHAEYLPGNIF